MSVEQEVVKLAKQLDKIVSEEDSNQEIAVDLLKALKDLPITLNVLQKTRIGMAVNVLRKSSTNSEVQVISKGLIKSWKKLLTGKETTKEGNSKSDGDSASSDKTASSNGKTTASTVITEKQSSRPVPPTNSDVRQKCREMLSNSLKIDDDDCQDAESIGTAIENCIFVEFRDTNTKYKARVRSRVSNLRDSKNPTLRKAVLSGEITPERMAIMTSEEMANDEIKNLRKKFTKEAIDDAQMAVTAGTPTDLFKCGKCQKRHCTYTQVQTRSADEPMTTFVYCQECGNRWKFC